MSAASLPSYPASSPRDRISAAACLGLAVALHLAVLALLPAGDPPETAPLPPVRVTLVSPPSAADASAPSAAPREAAPAPSARALARPPASEAPAKRAPARPPAPPETQREPRSAERAPAPAAPAPVAPPIAAPAMEAESLPEQPARTSSPVPAAPGDAAVRQDRAPSTNPSPDAAPGRDTVALARETLVPPSFDAAYLHNPKPEYPRLARRLGEQGTVVLDVYVGADGSPQRIQLKASSGSPRLDQAARETVARWKFVPAQQGGRPVDAWIAVPIRFVLEG